MQRRIRADRIAPGERGRSGPTRARLSARRATRLAADADAARRRGRPRMAAHDLECTLHSGAESERTVGSIEGARCPGRDAAHEQRRLQDAVNGLFDNELSQSVVRDASQRPLQSLGYLVKGKSGRFQRTCLASEWTTRASGDRRTGSKLGECGLPKSIALELFRPMLLGRLQKWRREHPDAHRGRKRRANR